MKKKELVFKFSKNDVHSLSDDSFYNKRQSSLTSVWPGSSSVDRLIDYLTIHLTELNGGRDEKLTTFEEATADALMKCSDPELHRILKEQGWTGTQFQLSLEPPFIDAQSCLNALSNYYLKVNSQPAINDIGASMDLESHQLDQIMPFCPDILVTYLKRQPINSISCEPRRLTFHGACMLADISGFSKFSGAMCSKGVSGLDDLREATNGFLGYFVKQVYEYEGDVIAFAGDALICAFRNSADGITESCFRALQCAHVLRQHKTAFLSTHIGVTCGEMQMGLLGGHNDQWCYVMNGDCVSELASCIEDAGPQEVAITEECYENALACDRSPKTAYTLRNQLQVDPQPRPSGNYLLKSIATRRTSTPPPPLSPFKHSPMEPHPSAAVDHAGDAHSHAGHWHAAMKSYSHVHEVAADVLTKQRSEHLIQQGRMAAMLSLARHSSEMTDVPAEGLTSAPKLSAGALAAAAIVNGLVEPVSCNAVNGSTANGSTEPTTSTPKTLGRKKSSIMESYTSPVMSIVSPTTDNSTLSASDGTELRGKMQSLQTRAKLTMVTPIFKTKKSSFTLGSGGEIVTSPSANGEPVSLQTDLILELPDPPTGEDGSLRRLPPTPGKDASETKEHQNGKANGALPIGEAVPEQSVYHHENGHSTDATATATASVGAIVDEEGPVASNRDSIGSDTATWGGTPVPSITSPGVMSPGIAELVWSPASRERERSGSLGLGPEITLMLPSALKKQSYPPRPTSQTSAQLTPSSKSVNFSREESVSDISESTRTGSPTPAGSGHEAAVHGGGSVSTKLAGGDGTEASTTPVSLSTLKKSEPSGYGNFTPQNSVGSADANKKRFAGWGVMKNALRRESFREKFKSTEAEFIQTISKFVPRPVLNAVHTECLDLIGELRQVTTMFVALNSYSATLNKDPCTLQPFFLMAQAVLHEAGGFLRQFLVDDKGCVFIAMWGVPSFTYSNNCNRALYCAAKIIEGSEPLGHKVSIGIATGTVFCGSVGALERRDYAGVGTDVNMAARLMSKAHGRILVDQATYRSLSKDSQQLLVTAEEMHLKGAAAPITPYQYASTALPRITDMDVEAARQSVLRSKMQSALSTLLDDFLNVNADTTLELLEKKLAVSFNFLFGLPGTGKTLAAQYYRNTARLRNINCLHLVAKADMQGVPYGLLREMFLELIGRSNFITPTQKLNVVTTLINEICDETDTEEERASALGSLELVLGIEAHELEDMRETIIRGGSAQDISNPPIMEGEDHVSPRPSSVGERPTWLLIRDRSSQSRGFEDYTFYNVVAYLLHNTPTVLIIENAHFVDELSWKELFLMQAGDQLDMSALLTMEVSQIPEGSYRVADPEALAAAKQKNLMNTSFSGDYWDAKEGQDEVVEVSEAVDRFASHDDVPDNFAHIVLSPGRGKSTHTGKLTSAPSTLSNASFVMDDNMSLMMSPQTASTEFWVSILDNKTTTVLVMGELSREEVRTEMARTLDGQTLTEGLVDLVYNITSGNAYWVKAMTEFIREQGAEQVFKAVTDRRSRQNPLKQLVLVHFETHLPELQVVSKHAAIIGVEFDEDSLRAIVPPKLKPGLGASLDKLAQKRFIQCLDPQDRTFCFPNKLIQTTLYELTPPSDAAHLHLLVAEYIENAFPTDLRTHYPTLGYHYKHCPDKRALAFKYELKAADQQVAKGAYSDGLTFLRSAAKLAEREAELDVTLEVINRAIDDIKEDMGASGPPPMSTILRLRSFYSGSNNSRTNGFVLRYNALKKFVLQRREHVRKEAEKERTAGEADASVDHKKELLQSGGNAEIGALTWQPSYVSRRKETSGATSKSLTSISSSSSLKSLRDTSDRNGEANQFANTDTRCACTIS